MIGLSGSTVLDTKTDGVCATAFVNGMTLDKSAANSTDAHCLLLNCCFMMNLLPSNHQANFPVSRVEQNFVGVSPERQYVRRMESMRTLLSAREGSPSAKFHLSWPVSGLANLRT
jgi:hypothetical protein